MFQVSKVTRAMRISALLIVIATRISLAFHLSFGHRLLRSHESLVRPIECRHNSTDTGLCMFSIDCMQNKGIALSICKHNYFVGTCCKLPSYNYIGQIVYNLQEQQHSRQAIDAITANANETQRSSSSSTIQDKYVISSTSLFSASPAQATTPTTATATSVTTTTTTTTASAVVGSSTTASSSALASSSPLIDSFQVQTSIPPVSSSQRQSLLQEKYQDSSYEFVKNELSATTKTLSASNAQNADDEKYELLTTINSAHSPLNFAPQSYQHIRPHLAQQKPQLQDLAENSKHNVYIVEEQQHKPPSSNGVIFANNHQSPVSSRAPAPSLQTTSAVPSSTATAAAAPPVIVVGEVAQMSIHEDAPQHHQSQNHHQQQQQSSAVPETSDLISSADFKFTTPFTSSISTALIPNISEITAARDQTTNSTPPSPISTSPVATTTTSTTSTTKSSSNAASATQPQFVSSSAASISSSPSSPSSSATTSSSFFVSPSSSGASSLSPHASSTSADNFAPSLPPMQTTSRPPLPLSLTIESPSANQNQSQMYSSHHTNKPLYPSTKIVSPNSSTANHLIPGFAGLHSAILSHLPLKIASGLSNGLSNYLANAIKPPHSAQRPFVSSNNAPALQYQLLNLNQTSSSSSNHKHQTQGSLIRFPGVSSSTTTVESPSSSFLSALPPSSSQTSYGNSGEVVGDGLDANNVRNFVEDARLVCGQPQVSASSSFFASVAQPHEAPLSSSTSTTATAAAIAASRHRVARIVGGKQSQFGQWPWMVSLRQWRKGAFLHKCGAALLNENWAITAAHCVENVKPSDLLLRLGEFDVSNQNEPFMYVEKRVKSIVAHSRFDPKTFEYDLALLKFAEPVKFERNILPVCVPSGNDTYVDRLATVIGWGRLYEDGPLPDVIQHVDVPIITNDECERMYKSAGYIEEIPNMFICAGISKGGKDSCEGDSGGPLTMVDNDGRSYLVGIISWGIGCALPSQPGVYTRITAFSSWINEITSSV